MSDALYLQARVEDLEREAKNSAEPLWKESVKNAIKQMQDDEQKLWELYVARVDGLPHNPYCPNEVEESAGEDLEAAAILLKVWEEKAPGILKRGE